MTAVRMIGFLRVCFTVGALFFSFWVAERFGAEWGVLLSYWAGMMAMSIWRIQQDMKKDAT